MQIRPAQATDFDQWLPLWKGYQAFYKTTIADAVTQQTWQRFLDPLEPMHCAVADRDGVLVGLVHYIEHRSCWTTGDYVYLQDLFALPEVRGQGVGRALIEHVYAVAREAGCVKVHWLTHETNATAISLYEQVAERPGFIQFRKPL